AAAASRKGATARRSRSMGSPLGVLRAGDGAGLVTAITTRHPRAMRDLAAHDPKSGEAPAVAQKSTGAGVRPWVRRGAPVDRLLPGGLVRRTSIDTAGRAKR